MRLIDADKILQETYGVVIKDMFHMTEKVEVVSAIDIKEAPTVKAIPVKWIENYIKQNYCTCDLVYPEEFLKELVTWWREDENEYKENTSQTD